MGHIYIPHAVAEMAGYSQWAEKLLSEKERETVIQTIAINPLAGALIEGTGGLRKIRFGKGK